MKTEKVLLENLVERFLTFEPPHINSTHEGFQPTPPTLEVLRANICHTALNSAYRNQILASNEGQSDPHPSQSYALRQFLTETPTQDERTRNRPEQNDTECEIRQRPYPCVHCGQRFKQKPHRNTHQLVVHMKAKNHTCYICSRAFGTRSNLHRHIKVTHDGRKEKCHICKNIFENDSDLKDHLMKVHQVHRIED